MTEEGPGHAETETPLRTGTTHADTADQPLDPAGTTGGRDHGRETAQRLAAGRRCGSPKLMADEDSEAPRDRVAQNKPNAHDLRHCAPHEAQGHGPGVPREQNQNPAPRPYAPWGAAVLSPNSALQHCWELSTIHPTFVLSRRSELLG